MSTAAPVSGQILIRLATPEDRDAIYEHRHTVYALELGQHAANAEGRLTDPLDAYNVYVAALLDGEVVGFISITPPGHPRYSIDKYAAIVARCRIEGLFLRNLQGVGSGLGTHALRLAVKDRATNRRMLAILSNVPREELPH